MTTFEEKVMAILEEEPDEYYESLTVEERKLINKYSKQQQILTLWQVLHKYDDLTTSRWRGKIREWLKNCVDSYRREYMGL